MYDTDSLELKAQLISKAFLYGSGSLPDSILEIIDEVFGRGHLCEKEMLLAFSGWDQGC